MARLFDGINDSLQAASVDLSAVNKFTLSLWLYWDAFANDNDLAMEFTADAGANAGFYLDPNHSTSSAFQVFMQNGNTHATFTRPSAAAWHHYLIHFDTSTNPDTFAVWVDAVGQSLTYGAQGNSGNFANSTLNFMSRNNTSLFGAGRMAEVAIFPGVLLASGPLLALANGTSPLLIPSATKPYYWPLIGRDSPEIELVYGKTATVNGAVQTAHIAVAYGTETDYELDATIRVTPTPASLVLTGQTPTVTVTNNVTVSPTPAALVLTGQVPTVTASNNITVSPSAASLVLTGQVPDVHTGMMIEPTPASLVLTGQVPTVTVAEGPCVPITSYAHVTFAQLKTLLAGRLSDPNKVFWVDTELGIYLIEAIRTWGLLSGFYSKRCTFNTVAGTAFYDLSVEMPGDMGYHVTDTSLVTEIQYHFIEAATGSSWAVPTQTDQFVLADATAALEKRRNQFLLETGVRITHTTGISPATSPASRVLLTDSIIDVRRVAWKQAGLFYQVNRRDEWSTNGFNYGWQAGATTPPVGYSLILTPPITLQLIPPAITSGTLDLLTVNAGAALNPATGVAVGIPDDFTPYLKWGAMADMLGKDGQARDHERATYCEQRWKEGLDIADALKSAEMFTIGNVPLPLQSVEEFDGYHYGWQNSSAPPTSGAMAGWNLAALQPVPDGVYTVTVDLVPNTPIPAADGDAIQIGREHIDIIIDYAEHLAAFKMAGDEWKMTMPQYQRFVRVAVENGRRNSALAYNLDVLRNRAMLQDWRDPRQSEEPPPWRKNAS